MKVLALNGSPHEDRVIHRGLSVLGEELEKAGIAVELIHAGHGKIRGCIDCRKCRNLGRCVFDDDPVNGCAEKLKEADGLVLGSPVYSKVWFHTPQLCCGSNKATLSRIRY
ncbi:MAG: flavodoxin family protein [Treponema sp.]|jgi:multimeric flavodoxin WrbA|nr:flavodoxin family protein [Treponema sp.]